MAVQSVRSASRPEVRSSICSISPWAWSKNWRTCWRPTGSSEPVTGQVVDEEPVALVGGDAPGAGVGLGQEAVPLEGGHVGPHGGRRHADPGGVDHVLGSDRLGRADVLGRPPR